MNSFKINYKVYSLKSKLKINPADHEDILNEFKEKFKYEPIAKAQKLPSMLKLCGWSPRIHIRDKYICGLIYKSDSWPNIAEQTIQILSRYIEPGGFIQMIDERKKHYWVYRFTGKSFKRDRLEKRFIDPLNKDELVSIYKWAIDQLIISGTNKSELEEIISDIFVKKLIK